MKIGVHVIVCKKTIGVEKNNVAKKQSFLKNNVATKQCCNKTILFIKQCGKKTTISKRQFIVSMQKMCKKYHHTSLTLFF